MQGIRSLANSSGYVAARGLGAIISSGVIGIVSLGMPEGQAIAAITDDYEICAASLAGLQISANDVASACARALKPADLEDCVSAISAGTPIAAGNALEACRQVRRPVELATCVVDIHTELKLTADLTVLDHCRRSLLPKRYASCVMGISRAASFDAPKAMDTCTDALYFPRELDPTFIPFESIAPSSGLPSDYPSDLQLPTDETPLFSEPERTEPDMKQPSTP